jgi:hypothetical protein
MLMLIMMLLLLMLLIMMTMIYFSYYVDVDIDVVIVVVDDDDGGGDDDDGGGGGDNDDYLQNLICIIQSVHLQDVSIDCVHRLRNRTGTMKELFQQVLAIATSTKLSNNYPKTGTCVRLEK